MKLIEIIPGLYSRGKLPEGTSPDDLEDVGVLRMISLIPPGESGLIGWRGYLHHPMSDGSSVDKRSLEVAVEFVLEGLRTGEGVLVACRAGRNRTGLVVSAALREWLGVSGKEALEMFRRARPRGVANPAFEKYLFSLPKKTERGSVLSLFDD